MSKAFRNRVNKRRKIANRLLRLNGFEGFDVIDDAVAQIIKHGLIDVTEEEFSDVGALRVMEIHRQHIAGKIGYFQSLRAQTKKAKKQKPRDEFYMSWEWKRARYEVLKKYGPKCMCCGSTDRIVVDHIKPRAKYPDLELNLDNLQVLCNDCNMGKGRWDETDWRLA